MKEHEFTLNLSGVEEMSEELSHRLFEAGCDDGSPFSTGGIAGIRFHRQSATLEAAKKGRLPFFRGRWEREGEFRLGRGTARGSRSV